MNHIMHRSCLFATKCLSLSFGHTIFIWEMRLLSSDWRRTQQGADTQSKQRSLITQDYLLFIWEHMLKGSYTVQLAPSTADDIPTANVRVVYRKRITISVGIHRFSSVWSRRANQSCIDVDSTSRFFVPVGVALQVQHPSSLSIPCAQYTFEGRDRCSETRLANHFPELYTIAESTSTVLPDSPTDVEMRQRNITWKAPDNDTIHSLNGFQVLSEGSSYESFGRVLCAVLKFSNITGTGISLLLNATFEVSFNESGDYSFEIKSLPLKVRQPMLTVQSHMESPTGSTKRTGINQRNRDGNCTIYPSTILIQCRQYMFKGAGPCLERNLQTRFPDVYAIDKSWPGPPSNVRIDDQSIRNITWKGPMDGSIRDLKGFQIRLEGNSFDSFGTTLCAVIYLKNNTEDKISSLINATFEFSIHSPGDFFLEIKTLPLPSKAYIIGTMKPTLTSSDTPEYHPNISVDIWTKQLNGSAINVTIDVYPNFENITTYFLEAYYLSYDKREVPEVIRHSVSSDKKYAVLGNLMTGNYTIKISTKFTGWFMIYDIPVEEEFLYCGRADQSFFNCTLLKRLSKVRPKEEFPGDSSICICYTGLPNRRSCTLCRSYVKDIQIVSVLKNIKKAETDFLKIGVPVVVTFILTILVAVCLLFKRARILTMCTEDLVKKRSIVLLHAWDNEAHDAVVKVFFKYLKERIGCIIITQAELQQMTHKTEKVYEHLLKADLIVIIHSESAHRLYNVFKTECMCNFSRSFGAMNDSFILCISTFVNEQLSSLTDKTISVYFDCTPREFVINDLQCNRFKLTEDFYRLDQYLQTQLKLKKLKMLNNLIYEEFFKQFERCKTFQHSNPYWFSDLYRRITKSSFSSDDSGVDIQKDIINNCSLPSEYCSVHKHFHREMINKYKRRSLSLDSLPVQIYRSASMQRGNSFIFSEIEKRFVSPEFGDEIEDTPTVLLTEQMTAINDRYKYIVDRDLGKPDFDKMGTGV